MVTCTFCARRKWLSALALLGGAAAALVVGWLLAGQHLSNLPVYLSQVYKLSAAYNSAASLTALPPLTIRGLIVLGLLVAILFLRFSWVLGADSRSLQLEGPLLFLWACSVLFLLWKHGFNRADLYHMGFFFGVAAIFALAFDAAPATAETMELRRNGAMDNPPRAPGPISPARRHYRRVLIARVLGLLTCLLVLSTLARWFLAGIPELLLAPLQNISLNLRALVNWNGWVAERNQASDAVLAEVRLPADLLALIGDSTVDVFGKDQLYALYNHLNYHPRPVFQSYCALSASLNRLNDEFYLSPRAPEFVLFSLDPLDHKFPPLEDSFVLRDLVLNYALASSNAPGLVLQRRTTNKPKLTLLREGLVALGKPIELKQFGSTNVWLELELAPTFAGRCRQFLYKPAPVRLVAWFNPGDLHANPLPGRTADAPGGREGNTKARWKAPAPMLSAGFLASPLLLDDRDVANVLTEGTIRRPVACSIEIDPEGLPFWQDEVRYRIYSVR
jgi:hypothetical protein